MQEKIVRLSAKKNNTQVNWYFLYILVGQLEGDWQTTIIN